MLKNFFDVVIIGAGPAGLSLSYFLQKYKISHLVLEQKQPFSQWYDRFDNFRMNTANWMNDLPGANELFEDNNHLQQAPDQLATGTQMLDYFQQYTQAVNPPIKFPCKISGLKFVDEYQWEIHADCGLFNCNHVVVCTGSAAKQKWTNLGIELQSKLPSLYSNDYRNPRQVKTGRVLVVGSGSSGIQICEDLARSSRFSEVTLSVSHNRRFPWKIFGVPIHTFVKHLGLFDLGSDTRLARWLIQMSSKRGDPATPPSPRKLARQYGVKCVRKIQASEANNSGDAGYFLTTDKQRISQQDLTVIWCTGFGPDYSLLPDAVQDALKHLPGWPTASQGAVPGFTGLHFLGLRFQSILSSHILYGIGRDAAQMADSIRAEIQ